MNGWDGRPPALRTGEDIMINSRNIQRMFVVAQRCTLA
jgi:hypothetical protein